MNSQTQTIPANSDKPCDCCGRIHRKLHLTNGYWLGQNCRDDYKLYLRNKDVNSLIWKGYERKHALIKKMENGR